MLTRAGFTVLTFSHNALHTDQVAQVPGGDTTWSGMFPAKAPLKPNMELLKLLPIHIINGEYKLPQGSLEGKDFKLGFVQEPG